MHSSAQRVADFAASHGLPIDVREFPEGTRTAEDAAAAIGVQVGQIVKSLLFAVDDRTILALVSGPNRLDEQALARASAVDGAHVARVDANTVKAVTGYSIGGVPPFGHPEPLPTYIDRDLLGYDVLWAAAGTPRHVFAVSPSELVRIAGATVADLREST